MAPHTCICRALTWGLGLNAGQERSIIKQSWPILTPRLKAHHSLLHYPQRFLRNFEFLSGHWINCVNSLIAKRKDRNISLENLFILAGEQIPLSAREPQSFSKSLSAAGFHFVQLFSWLGRQECHFSTSLHIDQKMESLSFIEVKYMKSLTSHKYLPHKMAIAFAQAN